MCEYSCISWTYLVPGAKKSGPVGSICAKSPTGPEATIIVDRYDPMNIFEMVPKLELEFEPELRELDLLLEDDELFSVVKADLAKRYPNSERLGRHSAPVEVILRMLLVKRLYRWSYQQTEHSVCDSLLLRQFCKLYLEAAPDYTNQKLV
jgi:transposase, IS5 family